jgi:hypothetical protein
MANVRRRLDSDYERKVPPQIGSKGVAETPTTSSVAPIHQGATG